VINELRNYQQSCYCRCVFIGGLFETWGRGTLKIIDECKKANLPGPIIEEITGGICVTVLKNRINDNYLNQFILNERQQKALAFLKDKGRSNLITAF